MKSITKDTIIRMTPQMSSNIMTHIESRHNAYSAFIRPEDVKAYEGFIDILDFKINNKDMEKTLFNIYKREYFNYNLKELIKQLNIDYVNNTLIPKRFAERRLNCQ